jgi:cytochrome c
MNSGNKRIWLGGGFLALCVAYAVLNTLYVTARGTRVMDAAPMDGKSRGRLAAEVCASCHHVSQMQTLLGPGLQGIVGRKVASMPGFDYSPALRQMAEQTWSKDKLIEFIQNPQGVAPGSKMVINGLTPQAARDVADYLESL